MMEHAVNADYRDRKAVKIAIDKLDDGEYVICDVTKDGMTFDGNPNNT